MRRDADRHDRVDGPVWDWQVGGVAEDEVGVEPRGCCGRSCGLEESRRGVDASHASAPAGRDHRGAAGATAEVKDDLVRARHQVIDNDLGGRPQLRGEMLVVTEAPVHRPDLTAARRRAPGALARTRELFRKAIQAVLAAAPDYSPTETPAMRRRDAAFGDMVTAEIIPCIFRIMNTSAATARTLQGMARVRSGQAPAWYPALRACPVSKLHAWRA